MAGISVQDVAELKDTPRRALSIRNLSDKRWEP